MITTIGKEGLTKTWQEEFPETTKCVHCKGNSRIGFVSHEGFETDDMAPLCELYASDEKKYWLHDYCAVAVYFCQDCLEPTALYNQG